ncbi:Extracellular deoxyribonuclease PA3909 (required for catabolism of external DNA) [hydrothermal vent metagenome]|uniref:Extracellular deoxyribonuclease PA3909 (Required for catabolism of external DNA) n=1 Tax=hydrothermal vent metagenome TaxID=652676 RepID=A0A3B0XQ57_9ZZZZ
MIPAKKISAVATLLCLHGLMPGLVSASNELYISEYIEGSNSNKALELYNDTDNPVDLSAYEVQFYFNGNATAGRTINLNGTVEPGHVFVLAHASASTEILDNTDQTTPGSWFNGNDAVVLLNGGTSIDAIGQIGVDPGTEWGDGETSTQNNTLRRTNTVTDGDTNAFNAFDPTVEWNGFALNTFDGLGSHNTDNNDDTPTPSPVPTEQLVINEMDADTSGSDKAEFIELFDGGTGNQDLTGYIVVLYNGNNDQSYGTLDLSGSQTDADGYFVIGNSAVAGVDRVIADGKLQNGADAVALYRADAADFPNGSPVSLINLIDAVVYDTNDADDLELLTLLNSGEPQLNEDSNNNKDSESNQRCPNGSGGALNSRAFIQALATPGQSNACTVITACGAPATAIHAIQGSTDTSPLEGQIVTAEAVVVGTFQSMTTGLSGFFIQEEPDDADKDPSTSEGIFIFDSGFGVDVSIGDTVRVTGNVTEFFGLTEINAVSSVEVCDTENKLHATKVKLPFSNATTMEQYEGMLVTLPQKLTVTENFGLGRFGEVVVSSNGRLFTPTNIVSPGPEAIALQAENNLNRLVIDDGNSAQNADPVIYPGSGLTALNTLRSGDTVKHITGVVSFSARNYRIHPTETPQFVAKNPRPAAPDLPGYGTLRIASFNVLNYFNGDGAGGGFPTRRGADTATEFTRQRDKIINAINAMQADIVGLMEIENNGYAKNSAIQDLVNGLNAVAPEGTRYAFIQPGVSSIGTDVITVGLIYREETVQANGASAILDSSVDSRFNDQKNRPTLAQTFTETATGATLTVAVNHLKSKGSSCTDVDDPNTGDGQGNCNITRTNAARALVDWLATDPTRSTDRDYLIIGDLNSYAKEDPLSVIQAAGYTNLVTRFESSKKAYSFNFRGQAGSLDHALANSALSPQITGTTNWHINTDEPRILDYNEEFKTTNQLNTLYSNDAFRASDHEPVVVELKLKP